MYSIWFSVFYPELCNIKDKTLKSGLSYLFRICAATEVTTKMGVKQLTIPCVLYNTLIVVQVFSSSHPGRKQNTYELVKQNTA